MIDGPADHRGKGEDGKTKEGVDSVAVSADETKAVEEHGSNEDKDKNLDEADVGSVDHQVLERREDADEEGIDGD